MTSPDARAATGRPDAPRTMRPTRPTRPRIVVVGGGFGGYAAVRALAGSEADVTLVDRTNHHLFQPLLYQVATAALSPADIATATRVLLRPQRNATVLMADVCGVDVERRLVRLVDGDPLPYDHLILATGAAYSFFGHDAWAEHAMVLKTLDDAVTIRDRLLRAFEDAERTRDATAARRLLTFVVIGGGPTGVELAGTIAELVRTTLAHDFRRLDLRAARIVLCEGGPRLLAAFDPPLSTYTRTALESLGIEVRLGETVDAVDAAGVRVGGVRIEAANVLWCAGTRARPVAEWVGARAARNGAVEVLPDCSIPGRAEIFAIGDAASMPGADGHPLPGLAAVAKQQGRYVGRLLAARLAGSPSSAPFRYRDWGTMAVIGRSRAVARLVGRDISGTVAWLAWSLVHLMLLTDFRSRMLVYVNWSWAWFTGGRGARLLYSSGRPAGRVPPASSDAPRDG